MVDQEKFEERRRDIELKDLKSDVENEDKKADAQRNMSWFALAGCLLYPILILVADTAGLTNAAKVLSDIAPTYFISVSAIVVGYYAKEGFTKIARVNGRNKQANDRK
jgi:hypothetical protein